jgi:hypothetical protein
VSASRVRHAAAALASAAGLALAAPPAHADEPPAFTAAPVVAGPAVVGAPMQVVAQWSGAPAPSALYEWERCDAAGLSCEVIDGACSATYVPSFDDFGRSLRARVDLWNAAGAVVARTPLSELILGSPVTPAAVPRAPTACGTAATPARQTEAQAPAPPLAPPALTAPAPVRAAYLRPFPVVRIRGYSMRGGVRITLLSVRGPRSARVRVTCAGGGCPRGPGPAPVAPPARLRHFERFLPAGTVLRVRVTAASAVGKYTSFRIGAHGAPRRTDRCLLPGRWAPARCPAP